MFNPISAVKNFSNNNSTLVKVASEIYKESGKNRRHKENLEYQKSKDNRDFEYKELQDEVSFNLNIEEKDKQAKSKQYRTDYIRKIIFVSWVASWLAFALFSINDIDKRTINIAKILLSTSGIVLVTDLYFSSEKEIRESQV